MSIIHFIFAWKYINISFYCSYIFMIIVLSKSHLLETDQSKLEKSDDTIKGVNCLVVYGRVNLLSNWVVLFVLSRQSKSSQMIFDIYILRNSYLKNIFEFYSYLRKICTKLQNNKNELFIIIFHFS